MIRAREALRSRPDDEWRDTYRAALDDAVRRRQLYAAADLAVLAAGRLEASGRYSESLAVLDDAVEATQLDSAAVAHLYAVRGAFAALDGAFDEARASLAHAAQRGSTAGEPTELEIRVHQMVVQCLELADFAVEDVGNLLARVDGAGAEWLASSLRSWFIPWLAAKGQWERALAVVEVLEARGRVSGHRWRVDDATAFRVSLASARGDLARTHDEIERNRNARLRLALTLCWVSLINGDEPAARARATEVAEICAGMSPLYQRLADGPAALVTARFMPGVPVTLGPPPAVTLLSLPLVLAAAEAVALSGRQADLPEWLALIEALVPRAPTCLEWPIVTQRIRALLLLRLGRSAPAIAALRQAVRAAEQQALPLEASIARVQFAEALALVGAGVAREQRAATLRQAQDTARSLGLDPGPFSYACMRAISLGRVALSTPKLSPREVQVLAAFADGLSYRETAARLGVAWHTVRVHAHSIYTKLGVRGRVSAIAEAERLEIIGAPQHAPGGRAAVIDRPGRMSDREIGRAPQYGESSA